MVSSVSSSASSWSMQRPDASQMASKIFSKLDTKNQGYIEKSDLESAFSQIGSTDSTSKVDQLFSQLDGDSDGKVTQTELADSLKKLAEQLDTGFNNMRMSGAGGPGAAGGMSPPPPPDKGDDSGYTKDELTSMASDTSSTDSSSALLSSIAANFDKADTDGDGKVTVKEAMAYEQLQAASSTTSASSTVSSNTTSVADTSSVSSANNATSAQTDVLMRMMQLVHAYGGFGQESAQNSISGVSSLSVTA